MLQLLPEAAHLQLVALHIKIEKQQAIRATNGETQNALRMDISRATNNSSNSCFSLISKKPKKL
jgi:hypothetical protein